MKQARAERLEVRTRWGMVTLSGRERLEGLDWQASGACDKNSALVAGKRWLEAFGEGRILPPPPFRLVGSEFQKRVWRRLLNIAFGRTASYKRLARELSSAPRAVGQAAGRNPLSIIVPCHRLIAADGSLGGYNGGTAIKSALLAHEQRFCSRRQGLGSAVVNQV